MFWGMNIPVDSSEQGHICFSIPDYVSKENQIEN